jgi:hypothetical protein
VISVARRLTQQARACTVATVPLRLGLIAAVLVALIAAQAGVATGSRVATTAGSPDASKMVLTLADLPSGATIYSQGAKTSGLISSASTYTRSFSGIRFGSVQTFVFENTVTVGSRSGDAAQLLADINLTTASSSMRAQLLKTVSKSFASSSSIPVKSTKFVRNRSLGAGAGDDSIELLFSLATAKGTFTVGEVYVRVGRVLGLIYYGSGEAGIPRTSTVALAKALASNIQKELDK